MDDEGRFESDDPGSESNPRSDDQSAADRWAELFAGLDDDEDTFDDAPTAPYPLPPDDRLWRHPSEVRYLSNDEDDVATTSRSSLRTLVLVGVAAGLIGAAVTVAAFAIVVPRTTTVVERVVERQAVQGAVRTVSIPSGDVNVADIAEAVTPSIVRVEVYRSGQSLGSGSGVIFRDDGHLSTNAHVVRDGDAVRVVMANGELLDAELVGTDTLTDIAVIRISERGSAPFVPATLGSSEELRAGEPAIAIGSPLRLLGGPTVTVGVVSAVNRRLQSPNGDWLYDLVQTDAPISPGSSGGALVDSSGALVGITTVIAVSEVGAEGLGFATPVEIAHGVAVDLMTWGDARHGLLGLRGEDASLEDLTPTGRLSGVVVRDVDPGGPAAAAAIRVGDIILSLDAERIDGMSDLVVEARLLDPGEETIVELFRDGEFLVVSVTVGHLR